MDFDYSPLLPDLKQLHGKELVLIEYLGQPNPILNGIFSGLGLSVVRLLISPSGQIICPEPPKVIGTPYTVLNWQSFDCATAAAKKAGETCLAGLPNPCKIVITGNVPYWGALTNQLENPDELPKSVEIQYPVSLKSCSAALALIASRNACCGAAAQG